MSTELILKAFTFGFIWLSFVLVLALMVISARREARSGKPVSCLLPLAAGVIALCTIVALASIAVRARKPSKNPMHQLSERPSSFSAFVILS